MTDTSAEHHLPPPVHTHFKRMYLVSAEVVDALRQSQQGNPPPPPPGGDQAQSPSVHPPQPPPAAAADPTAPEAPASSSSTLPNITPLPQPGPGSAPTTTPHAPPPDHQIAGPSRGGIPCGVRLTNGKQCSQWFDNADQLIKHQDTWHPTHLTAPVNTSRQLLTTPAQLEAAEQAVDQALHDSIEGERKFSGPTKRRLHQNADASKRLIRPDHLQCQSCPFRGNTPQELAAHHQDVHVNAIDFRPLRESKNGGKGRKGVKARSLNTVETYEQDSPVANNMEPTQPTTPSRTQSTTPSRTQPTTRSRTSHPQRAPTSRQTRKKEPQQPARVQPTRTKRGGVAKLPTRIMTRQNLPDPWKGKLPAEVVGHHMYREKKAPPPPTPEEQQHARDLHNRVKRRKIDPYAPYEPPIQGKRRKRKVNKKPKRLARSTAISRYKAKSKRTSNPAVQRNVAALGLSGYNN